MKAIRKVKTTSRELEQVQSNLVAALNPLLRLQLLDGVLLPVSLKSGSNTIAHTLKRQPLGWFLVDTQAAVTVYRTDWDTFNITLNSSADAAASLWVF